jgi:hypothetical protein
MCPPGHRVGTCAACNDGVQREVRQARTFQPPTMEAVPAGPWLCQAHGAALWLAVMSPDGSPPSAN